MIGERSTARRESEWEAAEPAVAFDVAPAAVAPMPASVPPAPSPMALQAAYGNAAVARAAQAGTLMPPAPASRDAAPANEPIGPAPAPGKGTAGPGAVEERGAGSGDVAAAPQAAEIAAPTVAKAPGAEAPSEAPVEGERVDARDPEGAIEGVLGAPPSQAVASLAMARRAGGEGLNAARAELAAAPPSIERPTGLPRKEAEGRAEPDAAPAAAAPEPAEAAPAPPLAFEVSHVPSQAALPGSRVATRAVETLPDDSPQLADAASQAVRAMPTDDASVDTSTGAPPPLLLEGEADPARMGEQEARSRAATNAAVEGAAGEIGAEHGENDIAPTVPREMLRGEVAPGAMPVEEPRIAKPDAPPDALASFNQAAAAAWTAEVVKAKQSHEAAKQEKADGEREHREAADAEIAQLESDAAVEQGAARDKAREGVDGARDSWKQELDSAQEKYGAKSTSLRTRYQGEIEAKREEADQQARAKLEAAEAETRRKKQAAEGEAAAKKNEALRKADEGFFASIKSGIKSFVQSLKDVVNAIFDTLRAAVKFVIEQAKKAALWIVEQARKAIVGLLRVWGALLCVAADVFLAAFPEARRKAKALIRGAVQLAERAVNAIAEGLKIVVTAVLDALGAALDFVLAVYQKAYNLLLDGLELVLVGLVEIMEGIVRLAKSASMVGDHFLGQMSEEGLGIDLTQPLPIEKRKTEGAPARDTAVKTAVEAGALAPSDAAVLGRQRLADSDVEADQVPDMQLDPELISSLPPMKDGDVHSFGENDLPENSREAVLDDAAATQGPAAPAATAAPETEESAAPQAPGTGVADPAASEYEKGERDLQGLEKQETPHNCDNKATEQPAGKDEAPEHMRIYGPFTAGQRFRYTWGQVKKGVSQWWSCNWGKIVAALAVGALITILLGILTSGAIFAAIPPLLTIIAALMTAYALVRAGLYVKDYVVNAWGGKLVEGAKALARAFAILVIELVFTLLFNLKAVLKAVKGGLKATLKAAVSAAKTAMKATVKAGRRLGKVLAVSAVRAVRNGRLILNGFRSGFARGVKTVGQLAAKVLRKSRFRGFYFRLRGLVLELWGRFNADVLLGKHKITLEDAKKWFEDIAAAGRKLTPEARKEAQALTEAVRVALQSGGLGAKLRKRVATFFSGFKSQTVRNNPILAEVWDRSLKQLADGDRFAKWFDSGGKLKPGIPDDEMKLMYKRARENASAQLQKVVHELENGFGESLGKEIKGLGENVEVHHLIYKSIEPEMALLHENLVLALRKSGGAADELHDLFHLLSSGGQGNRWRTLNKGVAGVIRDVFGL